MKNNLKNAILISWVHLFLSALGVLALDAKSVSALVVWALILYSLKAEKYLIAKIASSILILSGGVACAVLIYTHPPLVFDIPLQIGLLIFLIFALEVVFATFILRVAMSEDKKTKPNAKNIMKSASNADYEKAYNEVNSANKNIGLWARCLANAFGDEAKARAEYITIRTREITSSNTQESEVIEESQSLLLMCSLALVGCIMLLLLAMWATKDGDTKNDAKASYGASYKFNNCNSCLNGNCKPIPYYFGKFSINDSATAIDIQDRNEKGEEVTTRHPSSEKKKYETCEVDKIMHSFKCSAADELVDSTIEFNGREQLTYADKYKFIQGNSETSCSVSRIN